LPQTFVWVVSEQCVYIVGSLHFKFFNCICEYGIETAIITIWNHLYTIIFFWHTNSLPFTFTWFIVQDWYRFKFFSLIWYFYLLSHDNPHLSFRSYCENFNFFFISNQLRNISVFYCFKLTRLNIISSYCSCFILPYYSPNIAISSMAKSVYLTIFASLLPLAAIILINIVQRVLSIIMQKPWISLSIHNQILNVDNSRSNIKCISWYLIVSRKLSIIFENKVTIESSSPR